MSETTTGVPGVPGATARTLPRALLILLAAAAGVVMIALREVGWLVGPVMLALVLVPLFQPVHGWLRRKRVPEVLSLIGFLLVVFGALVAIVTIIGLLARLAGLLPGYASNAQNLVARLADRAGALGITREQLTTALSGIDLTRLSGPLATLIGHLTSVIATSAASGLGRGADRLHPPAPQGSPRLPDPRLRDGCQATLISPRSADACRLA